MKRPAAFALLLASLVPSTQVFAVPPVEQGIAEPPPPDNSSDAVKCRSENGIWGRWGLAPVSSCRHRTKDGGKACTSSSQCEGKCIAKTGTAEGTKTSGECSGTREILGFCGSFVENGVAEKTICID